MDVSPWMLMDSVVFVVVGMVIVPDVFMWLVVLVIYSVLVVDRV